MTCATCTDRATTVVTDNVLSDPETVRVMGVPVVLDAPGHSLVGRHLCDTCAETALLLGYTLQ